MILKEIRFNQIIIFRWKLNTADIEENLEIWSIEKCHSSDTLATVIA